jgi:hypothetical protein
VQGLLQLFLDAAQARGISTAAEELKYFNVSPFKFDDYTDPFVGWYNRQAWARCVLAEFEQSYDDDIVSRGYEHEGRVQQNATYRVRLRTSEALEDADWDGQFGEYGDSRARHGVLRLARPDVKKYVHEDPEKAWELQPECRKCYRTFGTRENLHAHLTHRPNHKVPFVRKMYNVLPPRAQPGGERKCWTCAQRFWTKGALRSCT